MSYEYSDPRRANEPHALPDVEVFHVREGEWWYNEEGERRDAPVHDGSLCGDDDEEGSPGLCEEHSKWRPCSEGFYYAYGFPGCLWDGEPTGPSGTYEEALRAAREERGITVRGFHVEEDA